MATMVTSMMVKLAQELSDQEDKTNQALQLHQEMSDVRNNLVFVSNTIIRLMKSDHPDAGQAVRAIKYDLQAILEQF